MQIKQTLFVAALVLVARAQGRAVVAEDVKGVKTVLQDEARYDRFFDHNPEYDFSYRILDPDTGDAKDQREERHGDAVRGRYSVVDPDGTLRVVKYTADDLHGFNAVVELTPGHAKPYVAPVKQRVAEHHVDVPVPVQHHVVPPQTAAELVANRRVQAEQSKQSEQQAGTLVHQHVIQHTAGPVGLHQDGLPATPHVHSALLQVPATAHSAQHIVQHAHQIASLSPGIQQAPIVQEQFTINQQEAIKITSPHELKGAQTVQDMQSLKGIQEIQNTHEIHATQAVQGSQEIQQQQQEQEQHDNKLQQSIGSSILPQVIEARHSVQQTGSISQEQQQLQQQQQHLQLRSLESEERQLQLHVVPHYHQRTMAVYRISPSLGGQQSGNFISFSSPYAHYTVS